MCDDVARRLKRRKDTADCENEKTQNSQSCCRNLRLFGILYKPSAISSMESLLAENSSRGRVDRNFRLEQHDHY